jgi:hypothetical protein
VHVCLEPVRVGGTQVVARHSPKPGIFGPVLHTSPCPEATRLMEIVPHDNLTPRVSAATQDNAFVSSTRGSSPGDMQDGVIPTNPTSFTCQVTKPLQVGLGTCRSSQACLGQCCTLARAWKWPDSWK